MRPARKLLRQEDGVSLVVAVGVLALFSISGVAVVEYAGTNVRTSDLSATSAKAFTLAEAGINEAAAVLNNPANNAMLQATLPATEATANVSTYEGGTVRWWGVLTGATWKLHALALLPNPTGAYTVKRKVTAEVDVISSYSGPLNNTSWNYMMSTRTGNECDMTLQNSVTVRDPVYTFGNLCLVNSAAIEEGPLVVRGRLWLQSSSTRVGSATAPISEAHIGQGCRNWAQGTYHSPCKLGLGAANDNIWADSLSSTPPELTPPTVNFAGWYANESTINDLSDCDLRVGNPPLPATDDLNWSNTPTILYDLTPLTPYSCRMTSDGTALGATVAELSWNPLASPRLLTVVGTIFLDGSAKVDYPGVNAYNGQASLYLSGTFRIGDNVKLCAGTSNDNCLFSSWNPNTEMLVVVTNGSGGDAGAGNGISLVNSTQYQGGFFATNAIYLGNSTKVEGPMIGSEIKLTNSVETHTFGTIFTAPAAIPGNPTVHAAPQPPKNFSG